MSKLRTVEEVVCKDIKNYNHTTTVYEDMVKLLTQDRSSIHTSLVAAVKEKAHKLWDHYYDISGEVKMVKLEDLLTIINSIFKE